MIYYLLSISILTLIFWGLHKARIIPICPICAGVVITWVGSIIALYNGTTWTDPLIIAILMGASMGALVDRYGHKFGLFWKSAVVLLVLPAIYFLIQKSLWQGLILVAIAVVVTVFSNKQSAPALRTKEDLFKECC